MIELGIMVPLGVAVFKGARANGRSGAVYVLAMIALAATCNYIGSFVAALLSWREVNADGTFSSWSIAALVLMPIAGTLLGGGLVYGLATSKK